MAEGIANNEENSSISINPLNNSPLALSPAQSINTQSHDNYAMSVDVSVPSTFSTLPPKKKQQLNMANLYVERIFRGFKKNSSQPTISSGSFIFSTCFVSSWIFFFPVSRKLLGCIPLVHKWSYEWYTRILRMPCFQRKAKVALVVLKGLFFRILFKI